MIGTSSSGITAPMNINAVIAHLVEMTPPQRKQFAQLHMDDPMMLSAAKFVDNQISKQAAALSAQRTGAAPPPVNQQVVAQMSPQMPAPMPQAGPAPQAAPMPQAALQQQAAPMPQGQAQPLPENTGIGQLPAPNMKGMADGGIVGYDEGGTVGTYRGADGKIYKYTKQPGFMDFLADKFSAGSVENQQQQLQAQSAAERARRQEAGQMLPQNVQGADLSSVVSAGYSGPRPRNMPITPAQAVAPVANMPPAAGTGSGQGTRGMPTDKKGIKQVLPDGGAQQVSKPTVTDRNYGTMYSDILKAQGDPRASIPKEIQEAQDLTKAQSDLEAASAEKRGKGLESLLAARNERLAGREGKLKEQESLNPDMALITAGLAMMQSTGKGLAGIGEGATKGMAQYMEGVKFNSAQRQKLEDARDALDELKFNQENMTEKERNAAKRIAMEGAIASKNAVLAHIQHTEGVNRKTADTLFTATTNALLTADEQRFRAGESALGRANQMQIANMLPGDARAAMLVGSGTPEGNRLATGLGRIADIGQDPRMYAEYQKIATDEMRGPAFKQQFPTFESYKAGMAGTGGGTIGNAGWGKAVKN